MANEKEAEIAPLLGEIAHPGRPKAGTGSNQDEIFPIFNPLTDNSNLHYIRSTGQI